MTSPSRVELGPAAARAFRDLPLEARSRVRGPLGRLARDAAQPGRIGGKTVKTIQGTGDTFDRLRVGDRRVMDEAIAHDRVILVLGIVHRGDLERWLRNRQGKAGAA